MGARQEVSWPELRERELVQSVALVLARRWGLGLGFVSHGDARAPRPCRADAGSPRAALLGGKPQMPVCTLVRDRDVGDQRCSAFAEELFEQLDLQWRAAAAAPAPAPAPALADSGAPATALVRTSCHAGLQELAAPVVVDGKLLGAVLTGGFLAASETERARRAMDERVAALALPDSYALAREQVAVLDERELSFVGELLQLAAADIARVQAARDALTPAAADLARAYAVRYSYDSIIGRSTPMQELYSVLDRLVNSEATVLIQGENGTGKELVARAVHHNSARRQRRFVVTNCSAFNDNLLDSELFGHVRGAFTGAIGDKPGLFQVADGGTFFLDEIGDMSPSLQVKVLRVLQEGTFMPVGSTETTKVNVRILAATNRDLKAMVKAGTFREDLYYRINVINLVIPPLRERPDDILLLAEGFLAKHVKGPRQKAKLLSSGCKTRFRSYPWPGNVRELENEIERLVVLSGDDREIAEALLSPRIRTAGVRSRTVDDATRPAALPAALEALERQMIFESLKRHTWNKTRAAAELEISRRNLIRLTQKYDLDAARPKRGR